MPSKTSEVAEVRVEANGVALEGTLALPDRPRGLVLFAHGSGSSRLSPRNAQVADRLAQEGLGTLRFDLLTVAEAEADAFDAHLRFDIPLLVSRLVGATDWALAEPATRALPLGYFGASTGAAAALGAAAERPERVGAVVSRGGRPDLAGPALPRVKAPTLLIVGGRDEQVIALNREAAARLNAPWELTIVPGATHLFEEPGALEKVADLAAAWFARHLRAPEGGQSP